MADITAHELSVEILTIVNNDMFSFDDVVQSLDEGYGNISFQVLLPRLAASADVLTVDGENVADLPTDYQRGLHFCYSVGQDAAIRIFDNKSDIIRYYGDPTTAGVVKGVAVFGTTLYYQRIPLLADIETLKIDYYKTPTTIDARTSTFTSLPPHLIRPLLVNFVCSKLFLMIEQGGEDKKSNTIYHAEVYASALKMLYDAYPTEKHRG